MIQLNGIEIASYGIEFPNSIPLNRFVATNRASARWFHGFIGETQFIFIHEMNVNQLV